MTEQQQQQPVSAAVVQHQAEQIEQLQRRLDTERQTCHNAIRLLQEQAEAMKLLERENTRFKALLAVQANLVGVIEDVNELTAEQFRVTIERVT